MAGETYKPTYIKLIMSGELTYFTERGQLSTNTHIKGNQTKIKAAATSSTGKLPTKHCLKRDKENYEIDQLTKE